MDKWLCWGSMAVAGLLLVVFLLDLIMKIINEVEIAPFGGLSPTIDVLCVLASGVIFYLALDAYRDVR
jgi:hypothetical protein